jgi:hypothetical protein
VRRGWPFAAPWLAAPLVAWCVAACAVTVPDDPVDPAAAATASAFVGQWKCSGPLDLTPAQPWCPAPCVVPAELSIVQDSPSAITTTYSAGTAGTCALVWTVDSAGATVSPNQKCSTGAGNVSVTYTAGTVMLTDAGMITGKITGVFAGDFLGSPVSATGQMSPSCQRH